MSNNTELDRRRLLVSQYTQMRAAESRRLLHGYRERRLKWADGQKLRADGFNLFEVAKIDRDELRHSRLLAWLLDHRIEYGTHAQGTLGFRLFLEVLRSDLRVTDADFQRLMIQANERDYWVSAEVKGANSRVDIEVAARRKFLIHIENKIHSTEGDGQTNREYADLQIRGEELGVPAHARHGIFLTLRGGSPPKHPEFRHITWDRIAAIMSKFADVAEAAEVRLFLRHYAKSLQNLGEITKLEVDSGEV